ncbi:bacteriohemerythrin [Thauera sp. 2A1]|uniref:bacteriohemerythrin n=1 Tax=Thauera sp. 2A1 TaxID=2570191 RepID=UPI00210C4F96|nr:bacteriohemerythrin [Thauera sp. 2A1]KAI5915629.1 bacteriohemerythrin [Thauera sp. 2A1]
MLSAYAAPFVAAARKEESSVPIQWNPELDTGIDVIDKQHRRIVDYINDLEIANAGHDRAAIEHTLDALVDYTMSHFAFEESLQEEAGYAFCKAHKRVHELFARRVNEYVERHRLGDDVGSELVRLLTTWLVNHIKRDDADYVGAVKAKMIDVVAKKQHTQGAGWFRRFFGRAA